MSQANMDLGIFQETKCTEGIYTPESVGYRVISTDAPSRYRGRVALFYRPSPLFKVEAVQEYGPNVLSFEVAMGARQWYIGWNLKMLSYLLVRYWLFLVFNHTLFVLLHKDLIIVEQS